MPVLLASAFNEDGTANVMDAARGTMPDGDIVALNLTATHKTVQNIKARKVENAHGLEALDGD